MTPAGAAGSPADAVLLLGVDKPACVSGAGSDLEGSRTVAMSTPVSFRSPGPRPPSVPHYWTPEYCRRIGELKQEVIPEPITSWSSSGCARSMWRRRRERYASGPGTQSGGSAGQPGVGRSGHSRRRQLADHLIEQGIEKVTVEATSDYWRIWFYLLEAAGLDVQLVNRPGSEKSPGTAEDGPGCGVVGQAHREGHVATLVRGARPGPATAGLHQATDRSDSRTHPALAATGEAPCRAVVSIQLPATGTISSSGIGPTGAPGPAVWPYLGLRVLNATAPINGLDFVEFGDLL
jgi:hypothetical protein